MILKKLQLKNIASIEEAEIRFDQPPLDQPVFLICGDTGSGKTTILDAICLALYNKTPRLSKIPRETYADDLYRSSKSTDANIGDSRQLMRRNTAEAWSMLEFTGSDEHEYRAMWYVARSRKHLDGNIQDVKWSLEDLTEQHVWEKKTEVEQIIQWAIGLTFEQYCRTAMLAQGDFTLFLKSNENDKSEILEKLTGTEIYTRIGAQIFATTRDKKKEYEELQKRLTDIQILSEEEVRQISDSVLAQQEQLKILEQQENETKKKLDWLNRDRELADQIQTLEIRCEKNNRQQESQEMKQKQELLTLWSETEEIRPVLKQKQEAEKELRECRYQEQMLLEEYRKLHNGLATLLQEQARLKETRDRLEAELQASRPLAPMYEQSQALLRDLQALVEKEQRIAALQKEIQTQQQLLPENLKALEGKKKEATELTELLENKQKEITEVGHQIGHEEYPRLQQEQKKVNDELLQLTEAQKVILLLKEKVEQKTKASADLQETIAKIQANGKLTEEGQEKARQAEQRFRQTEALYEKQQKAVSDWAREMRQELHAGDHCPVCGALIGADLHEEDFQSILAPLKEDLEQKKLDKERTEKEYLARQAEQKSLNDSRTRQEKELQKATEAYTTVYQRTVETCRACGILRLQKETQGEVDQRIAQNRKRQEEITIRMTALQALINRQNQLQQEKNGLQKQADQLGRLINNLEVQISTRRNSIEEQLKVCRQEEETRKRTEDTLLPQLLWENRDALWQDDRRALIRKLETEAEQYHQHSEKLNKLTESLRLQQVTLDYIGHQKAQVLQAFPQWTEEQALSGEVPHQPDVLWNQFAQKTAAFQERVRQTEQVLSQTRQKEMDFFKGHPALSREAVCRLMELNGAIIQQYREEIQRFREQQIRDQENLKQTLTARQEHLQRKLPFGENDTTESLTADLRTLTGTSAQINQNIGGYQAQLENNRKNVERSQSLLQNIERSQKDYFQWNRLCTYFGDATGKTFRNIAQSFVLKELLERANYYLGHLTERYELSCQSGSLTILLTDWYQGGAVRPTSTLSGGEGFLVSLSLALGLSSLNRQSLSVDTLFIDEGFGTLSSDYLNVVMDTLERLHQMGGKKVGIISHVEGLRERIKTQIRVQRIDQGRSRIEVIHAN